MYKKKFITILVSSFNLLQSFNYTPYLFYIKRFKSEINAFCIRTLKFEHGIRISKGDQRLFDDV
jgi:hypothetical protein